MARKHEPYLGKAEGCSLLRRHWAELKASGDPEKLAEAERLVQQSRDYPHLLRCLRYGGYIYRTDCDYCPHGIRKEGA